MVKKITMMQQRSTE